MVIGVTFERERHFRLLSFKRYFESSYMKKHTYLNRDKGLYKMLVCFKKKTYSAAVERGQQTGITTGHTFTNFTKGNLYNEFQQWFI